MSVKITMRTDYQIHEILETRVRRGIRAHPFRRDDRPRFRQLDQYVQHQATEALTLLCHSSERRLPCRVSGKHHLEFQDPTDQTSGSHNRFLRSRRFGVFLHKPGIGEGTTAHLFVLEPDWATAGGRHAQALSVPRPIPVSQGPSCVLQLVLSFGGKCRMSVDRDRRALKTGHLRPISRYSETACCCT